MPPASCATNSPAASRCATCQNSFSNLTTQSKKVPAYLTLLTRSNGKMLCKPRPRKRYNQTCRDPIITCPPDRVRAQAYNVEEEVVTIQTIDPTLVQQAMALIKPAQRIALIAHEHPDGDCLGSALGLAHILRQAEKTCVAACADLAPHALDFLPGIGELQHTLDDENFDLIIALDANELIRFGSLYE